MQVSKIFYAALLPLLYSNVSLAGNYAIQQFSSGTLDCNPGSLTYTRQLHILLNYGEVDFIYLSNLVCRALSLMPCVDLCTISVARRFDLSVERQDLLDNFRPLASILQAKDISYILADKRSYHDDHYQDEDLFKYVSPRERRLKLPPYCTQVTVIDPPSGKLHPFRIWYAKEKYIGCAPKETCPIGVTSLDQIRHLNLVNQSDEEPLDLIPSALQPFTQLLSSLSYSCAYENIDTPMRIFLRTLPDCHLLRYLKIDTGVDDYIYEEAATFWAILPPSLETLELRVGELQLLAPFYLSLRDVKPWQRTQWQKLGHFVCHIRSNGNWDWHDDDFLRHDWIVGGDLVFPRDSTEWLDEAIKEAGWRFIDAFLGTLRFHGILCTGRNNPGNHQRPLIVDYFKPARQAEIMLCTCHEA